MTIKMLAPGIYDDGETMHIVADEIATATGVSLEWLQEGDRLEQMVREAAADVYGAAADQIEVETSWGPPPFRGVG